MGRSKLSEPVTVGARIHDADLDLAKAGRVLYALASEFTLLSDPSVSTRQLRDLSVELLAIQTNAANVMGLVAAEVVRREDEFDALIGFPAESRDA